MVRRSLAVLEYHLAGYRRVRSALSIPVAWINRKRENAGEAARPDYEFSDLSGLADAMVPDSPHNS